MIPAKEKIKDAKKLQIQISVINSIRAVYSFALLKTFKENMQRKNAKGLFFSFVKPLVMPFYSCYSNQIFVKHFRQKP